MFNRIMVPLDGSGFAETALPTALALRSLSGARLELVSVHEPVPNFWSEGLALDAQTWMDDYLADVVQRLGSRGGAVDITTSSGFVGETLVNRAAESGADLTVMATHGRGPLTRAWLGSVADYFVRHAAGPVLLVRPEDEEHPDLSAEVSIGSILVPLDGSALAESALAPATELAKLTAASVLLMRAVVYPVDIASPYLPHTVQVNQEVVAESKEAAHAYLAELAEGLRADGLVAEVDVRVGPQAGRAIVEAAEEHAVDLIAMTSHARGGMARALLGSAADKVIRASHRSVLVFRPTEE